MLIRQRLSVRGVVQGVGFRPFVYRLAQSLELAGWVRNGGAGVTLEIQGDSSQVMQFIERLQQDAPPLSRIEHIAHQNVDVIVFNEEGCEDFVVLDSHSDNPQISIGPDNCTCLACLSELFDPSSRRYRYAFINCTDCGPRYTLVRQLPYDRVNTCMARFEQCPACLAEYTHPAHRRFHAEPNACPDCGPQLSLLDTTTKPIEGDPITQALACLQAGQIVAIKGLGGFHLACDARNAAAVARLRERKDREEKPLAVMVANVESLADLADMTKERSAYLQSSERPIVLMPKLSETDKQLMGVAPDLAWIGAMLPYTPLHYLLFHEAAGRPEGTDWLDQSQSLVLVMTSANRHGEPLVIDNQEALDQLADIADVWLMHDRDIVIRCDDSVVRPSADGAQFIRRSRGYTPRALPLQKQGPSVLALGGFFKNALCLTRGREAFMSQHIGDLDRPANCRALDEAVNHLIHLTGSLPQCIAHDRHPDFYSTQLAQRLAQQWQIPSMAVQHHYAHIAAVLAEHHLDKPVLGLALDGVGLGDDGEAWGGELLRVDGAQSLRLGHLQSISLPGGDRAAREPWRMGAAALALLGRSDEISRWFADERLADSLGRLFQQNHFWPQTSSMGRWFDAAAGLLGIKAHSSFEGQAAMMLEGLAAQYGALPVLKNGYSLRDENDKCVLDLGPLLGALSEAKSCEYGAALFHGTLIEALADWVWINAKKQNLDTVACGGGCFLNVILSQGLKQGLTKRGLEMLESKAVSPGDGGLALGQAWVVQNAGL